MRGDQVIPVLVDINLDVAHGDFVALMGPSGSGKSTLLNLIAGIDKPTAGEIRVAGVDIAQLSDGELAAWRAAHVGFIFQFYNLMPVLTAFEQRRAAAAAHVAVAARAARARRERRSRSSACPTARPLSERALGRPAAARRDCPRADHRSDASSSPTSRPATSTATTAEEILGLLDRLNRELGKTIIMVTHDPKAAEKARRLVHLEKGVLVD